MQIIKSASISAVLLASALSINAQITTSAFVNAIDLANALAAGSPGITINSASYIGSNSASGFFTSTPGLLPFNSGIVLTSGDRANVEGTNTGPGTSTSNGLLGDAGLSTTASQSTFDASVLEIRFTPTNNVVSFQYVFGSEEYNEFVGSFNDVFAFFLNGTNIALIPGGSTPVSINAINNGSNPDYYFDNAAGSLPTQYDGLVGRNSGFLLFATGAVNPGVENIMRIAIADAGDSVLDSGVFLAAGSFKDTPPPVMTAVPEPSTYALFASFGLLGLIAARRFKKSKA